MHGTPEQIPVNWCGEKAIRNKASSHSAWHNFPRTDSKRERDEDNFLPTQFYAHYNEAAAAERIQRNREWTQ